MRLSEFKGILEQDGFEVYNVMGAYEDEAYIVCTKYSEGQLLAENQVIDDYDIVQLSYFTKNKTDGNISKIKKLLNTHEIPYDYKPFLRGHGERDHHVFDCELI